MKITIETDWAGEDGGFLALNVAKMLEWIAWRIRHGELPSSDGYGHCVVEYTRRERLQLEKRLARR